MQFKSILAVALAACCCVPAMAQRNKKKSKKQTKTEMVRKPQVEPVAGKDFSYALGIAQGGSLKQYLIQQMGVDSAYVKYAIEGLNAKMTEDEQKRKTAYAAGLKIAEINKRNLDMFNRQACGKSDSTYIELSEFQRALSQVVMGDSTQISQEAAMKLVEQQLQYQRELYKINNENWLVANKSKKGVKTLPSGLQYEIIKVGKGVVATDSTQVDVHYEGKLIDGTIFDSSYKRNSPASFRPGHVIKGWNEALKMMPEGSVWMLYIPSSLAYGERDQGQQIPANSTLIFKVEVLKVKTPETAKIKTPETTKIKAPTLKR